MLVQPTGLFQILLALLTLVHVCAHVHGVLLLRF